MLNVESMAEIAKVSEVSREKLAKLAARLRFIKLHETSIYIYITLSYPLTEG